MARLKEKPRCIIGTLIRRGNTLKAVTLRRCISSEFESRDWASVRGNEEVRSRGRRSEKERKSVRDEHGVSGIVSDQHRAKMKRRRELDAKSECTTFLLTQWQVLIGRFATKAMKMYE